MPILTIVIVLIVVGVILYLINNYIPMDSKIKSILNIVVVIVLIIWLLKAFGLLGSLGSVKVQAIAYVFPFVKHQSFRLMFLFFVQLKFLNDQCREDIVFCINSCFRQPHSCLATCRPLQTSALLPVLLLPIVITKAKNTVSQTTND